MKFNVSNFGRNNIVAQQLDSVPFADFVNQLIAAGETFDTIEVRTSLRYGSRMLIGKDNGEGGVDTILKHWSVGLSDKLKFNSDDAVVMFNSLYANYPLYYGKRTVKATPEELEEGAPETREVFWLTAGPVGEYEPAKTGKINVASLVKGSVAGMPSTKVIP